MNIVGRRVMELMWELLVHMGDEIDENLREFGVR